VIRTLARPGIGSSAKVGGELLVMPHLRLREHENGALPSGRWRANGMRIWA